MYWEMATMIGYEPKTTFWEDFSIAEKFGISSINETAARAFNEWKNDIEYLTELIMVINHKSWFFSDNNPIYSDLYANLYYQYDRLALDYITKNMGQNELSYYFNTLD